MKWAVILAGGSGTRFWPLSTPDSPKQLLPLTGPRSTAEDAVVRLEGLVPRERYGRFDGKPFDLEDSRHIGIAGP